MLGNIIMPKAIKHNVIVLNKNYYVRKYNYTKSG